MTGSGGSASLSATAPSSHARKISGFVGIERGVLQLDELIAAALEHDPLESVRRNADEALAFLALAIGEIVRHAPDHIVPFLIEVPLGFENGAPDQGIEPTLHFGNAALEIERAELDTELLHQELPKIGFHLVMAGTGGEMMQEFAGPRIVGQTFPRSRRWGVGSLQPPNLVDNGSASETYV